MALLRIKAEGFALDGKDLPLPTEGRLTIGRDSGSAIALPQTEVSRAHAVILCAPGRYQIEDSNSRRGTFVGKERVTQAITLKHKDEIRVGPALLVFLESAEVAGAGAPAADPKLPPGFDGRPSSAEIPDFGVPVEIYSDQSMALKKRIHARVLEKLNLREIADQRTEDAEMRHKMEQALDVAMQEIRHELPPKVTQDVLRQAMLDELLAYGPITPMLKDPSVKEIMVNGPSRIFVEQHGIKQTRARFADDQHLMGIIRRIVEPLGRHVDESSPKVDARLPDGSRVNAIIPPLALDGPSLTIRKFPEEALTVRHLIDFGSLTAPMGQFLEEAVRAKQNIVVSGGTGSGKTTLLNVLSQFIPPNERIVTIEDSAELRLAHQNLVRLEARPSNIEGKGAITIRDLVINALRMRPDPIVVGECRGPEALDMLQAMSTGHDGSLTTVHANDPRGALSRLETMVLMAGYDLPSRAIREQIVGAVNLIVQQSRLVDNSRKIERITEITGREGDTILMQDIFLFDQTGFDPRGKVVGQFKATGNKPRFVSQLKDKGDLRLDMAVFKTGD